jgi:hypothetical protein
MPRQKIIRKSELDKFYTNPQVAKGCLNSLISLIGIERLNFLRFVEPSAGNGAFSRHIICSAYDIAPDDVSIQKLDYLNSNLELSSDTCIFGNPPFGDRNSLSKAFIEKSISYRNVKLIAFVLPDSYSKKTMQRIFPSEWRLILTKPLPVDSFTLQGTTYHVPCKFYVWDRSKYLGGGLFDLREVSQENDCTDFKIVGKFDSPDLFMFGAAPTKLIAPDTVNKNNRGHYLKINIPIQEFRVKINSVDWKMYGASSVSGGVSWFTKDEIIKLYKRKYQNEPKSE